MSCDCPCLSSHSLKRFYKWCSFIFFLWLLPAGIWNKTLVWLWKPQGKVTHTRPAAAEAVQWPLVCRRPWRNYEIIGFREWQARSSAAPYNQVMWEKFSASSTEWRKDYCLPWGEKRGRMTEQITSAQWNISAFMFSLQIFGNLWRALGKPGKFANRTKDFKALRWNKPRLKASLERIIGISS